MAKTTKMTKQEIQEWDDLYQYVKKDIFEYDTQKLSNYMIMRLLGLKDGKFMANIKIKPMASYEFNHILYTFKINKIKLKEIVKSDKYNSEKHKINTIMLIIEGEINDVVNRLNNRKKAVEKIENINLENIVNEDAEYKNKSKDNNAKLSKEFEELW